MMTRSLTLEAAVGVCLLAIALPWPAAGEVSDEEFQALKKDVQKLTQEQQKLAKAHEEDQKKHAEDQQKIQQLQQQLVNEALKAPSQVQPAGGPVSGEEFNSLKSAVDKLSQQYAESTSSPFALQNFMIVGDAETQFAKIQGQHGGFAQFDFAPIFLFRFSDDLLFEAGFDFTLQDNGGYAGAPGGTTYLFDLSFAQLDYVLNQYATLVTGDMLLPLGTYAERSAGWLNKFPDDPFSRAVLPSSGVGAQLRGGVPVDASGQTITYAAYVDNGPSSVDGTGNAGQLDLHGNVGVLPNGQFGNLHGSPSAGGRIGWFFPYAPNHYDVELGISGQTGTWNNSNSDSWSAGVVDAALHLGPYFEAKGEFINTWEATDDQGHFNPRGLWAQLGYKLAGLNLDLPVVNDVELVGRYDDIRDGLDSIGMRTERYSFGFVYYISNKLHFMGDYEIINGNRQAVIPSDNQFILQLTYGF